MISKAYEKADFEVLEFSLEDTLTSSTVVHTTQGDNSNVTLPGTTASSGSVDVPFSDFFQ